MKYIFIHGLGQNSSSWKKTLSFMEKNDNYECIDLLTLCNNVNITYENLYNLFSGYCNNIFEPINLCGLSLGGNLALNYVIDYPEKINSLILIGTQDKMPKFLLKIQKFIFGLMSEKLFKSNGNGFEKKHFIQIIDSMKNLDFSKKIENILCSTLIICGKNDIFNIKSAKKLANNIQNAKLVIIKKSGHVVNTDTPKELALAIEGFYRK